MTRLLQFARACFFLFRHRIPFHRPARAQDTRVETARAWLRVVRLILRGARSRISECLSKEAFHEQRQE
jgi:hypothetical protein